MSLRFRSDARPEQLAKDLLLSPLIYIRLLGIVSASSIVQQKLFFPRARATCMLVGGNFVEKVHVHVHHSNQ